MLAALPLLLLGLLEFNAQEISGIYIGVSDALSGAPTKNFLQADLNHDGRTDLLLLSGVLFQHENGTFSAAPVPLPEKLRAARQLQPWQGALYGRSEAGLEVYRWTASGWQQELSNGLSWHAAISADGNAVFDPFLYDFNGDGTPEALSISPEGVYIHAKTGEQYASHGPFPVYPALDLVNPEPEKLWPPTERRMTLPLRERAFRVLFEQDLITVLQRRAVREGQVQWGWSRYKISTEDWTIPSTPVDQGGSQPMQEYLRPCRLNMDAQVDFAGGSWKESNATFYGLPLFETWVSLNNGQSFRVVRTPSFQRFRPQCSFVDIDGDGNRDLVVESAELFRSGPRELITQLLTRPAVDHLVRVYRLEGIQFRDNPTCEFKVRIMLNTVPSRNGPMFQRYQMGEILSFMGDFDGDNFRDIIVQEKLGEVRIYVSRGGKLGAEAANTFAIPANADVRVYDMNGDGKSDVLVQPKQNQESLSPRSTAYLSKTTP